LAAQERKDHKKREYGTDQSELGVLPARPQTGQHRSSASQYGVEM
jgi:hypothetical protein